MRDNYIPLMRSTLNSTLWSLPASHLKVFLSLALDADEQGFVIQTIPGIAARSRIPIEEVEEIVSDLEKPDKYSKDKSRDPKATGARIAKVEGSSAWRIVNMNWYRDEARRQSILATKRKSWHKAQSSKKEKDSEPLQETRHLTGHTETETETETDTNTEIKTNKTPHLASLDVPPKPKAKKGTRLPMLWKPTVSQSNLLAQGKLGSPVSDELEIFKDYWFSVSGAKGVKLDWDATWRNWCRRAGKSNAPRMTRQDQIRQNDLDKIRKLDELENSDRTEREFNETF